MQSDNTTTSKQLHLLTYDEFRQLARPTSVHLDADEVEAYIDEAEELHLIPAIGYYNFKAACTGDVWDSTLDASFVPAIAISGGEWEDADQCGNTHLHYNKGLKSALAYFAYAKMLKADGTIVSRAGAMRHQDDYAQHLNDDRRNQYNDVMDIAEKYLADTLQYIHYHQTKENGTKPQRGTRARIVAVGD